MQSSQKGATGRPARVTGQGSCTEAVMESPRLVGSWTGLVSVPGSGVLLCGSHEALDFPKGGASDRRE